MSLLEKFFAGDVQALSSLITEVESRSDGCQAIVAAIYPRTGRACKLGITGPPGAGKSSLVDRFAGELAAESRRVGIIAVDPTSPFSGGAFLGDRVRMRSLAGNENVYIRSMASRGAQGGLSVATFDACLVLDAFGKDWIIMETVGVGQIELDVAQHADTVVVALSPESGDSIQASKAGLMEIGDVFVVNKADREGATNLVTQLNMTLEVRRKNEPWSYPVLATVATTGQGVAELGQAVRRHREFLGRHDRLAVRRKTQLKSQLRKILEDRIRATVSRRFHSDPDWDKLADRVYLKQETPYGAADRILAAWRS
ncbi:MAG: methylmalonyl Co-A mutase-associated GTPase MeaB [Verrucomicrobiota bacterium]|nr:methylmalonyl Co-A mutase-associated GTPase MeaB [Verrucomicrobiota bacterium]